MGLTIYKFIIINSFGAMTENENGCSCISLIHQFLIKKVIGQPTFNIFHTIGKGSIRDHSNKCKKKWHNDYTPKESMYSENRFEHENRTSGRMEG